MFGERFPFTNTHELNLDWIIKQIKYFRQDYGNIEEFINEAVNKYIEEHPDYNVQDESITSKKLFKESIPFYNVADYGIMPDSGDVYLKLHDLIKTKVYHTGGILYFPKGKYTVSYTLFIPENTVVMGEGKNTEIYFDESDTEFGTCLCNAGSDVTIRDITISQASTGIFSDGPQPGCIGFTNISHLQCQEEPYSHNFIRQSKVANLTAENVYFKGFYAIQTEGGTGSTITNIVYRNLESAGCVSLAVASGTAVENMLMDNIKCDLLRIINEGTALNVSINNVILNSLTVENEANEDIVLNNVLGTGNDKHNTYLSNTSSHALIGNVTIQNSLFYGNATYNTLFNVYTGIRHWTNVTIICTASERALIRLSALSETTNYEVMQNCNWTCATDSEIITTVFGYGQNNVFSGYANVFLWGQSIRKKNLSSATTYTYDNYLYANNDTVEIQLLVVPDTTDMPNIFTMPEGIDLPFDNTSGYVQITLWDHEHRDEAVISWGKIDNNKIVITDSTYTSSLGDFDRALVKQELRLTRTPTMEELYNTFLA